MKCKHSGFKLKSSGFSPVVLGLGLLYALILISAGCKCSTDPKPADCETGYHPCEHDNTICCLDSTSHSFSWEIDSLGIYGSYLNDVAIVDENDIWVVGNIETDSTSYNAAHYDGSEWELTLIVNPDPIMGIIYFSDNDIWMVNGYPIHWDGNEWTLYPLHNYGMQVAVEHLWGTSSSNMYFVGLNGSIVHYDGSSFVQMASGTDVDLKDIAGTPDGEHVFAVGREHISTAPSVALEFENGNWNTLYYTEGTQPHDGNLGWIYGVDVLEDTVYFSTTSGLWKYNYMTNMSLLIPNTVIDFNSIAVLHININSQNDIFFVGAGGHYIHFNGFNYILNGDIYNQFNQSAALGADYNGQISVIVGYFNVWAHAFVARVYHE